MATLSVETLILFIAAMVVAAGVGLTLTTEVGRVSSAITDQGVDVSQDIRTDVEVISDAGSADQIYNTSGNENVTLYMKNTGSETLPADPDQIDVLINGTFASDMGVTVVDGSEWQVGNVVELELDMTLGTGDHRIKIVVREDEEVFEFRL